MKTRGQRTLLTSIAVAAAAAVGCAQGSPVIRNADFGSLGCDGGACAWETVAGSPRAHGTWHPGDPGMDLSGSGLMIVQQQSGWFDASGNTSFDVRLFATVLRDPGVELQFEIEWLTGPEEGPLRPLSAATIPVLSEGLVRFSARITIPLDANAAILRIVRNGGEGRCWVDQLAYKSISDPSPDGF